MSKRERGPASSADSVDLSATLELLASLTQYAEAGAVQPHTLAQAAQHALEKHGDHVEVLVAVAKLQLSTGQRDEAAVILSRAARLFPHDSRVEQLMVDSGFSFRRRRDAGGPESTRGPASVRSRADAADPRSHVVPVAAKGAPTSDVAEDAPPATSRSSAGPTQRPTVRMARVAATPERQRWGKPEAREPFDSRPTLDPRPAFDSRPDRDFTPSDGPRSVRSAGPRAVAFRELAITPASPMPRAREDGPRSARAATGNLKLLDPQDERRRLDRYELIGEIASGGMASVFLARLAGVAGFQRFFAIKRLHPHLADDQEFIEMFLDEARLAAGIHHPNVVPILEVGTSEAGYYLVMDYIEGDTLAGLGSRFGGGRRIPQPIALRVMLDALQGLHAAHELTDADGYLLDLVHRDCSPQNILVGVDGSSRITDFGVARASARLTTTRNMTVKGKLAYLSPEQATGGALDRRSDLFGMGVILWESLAGRRLFRADTEAETLSRILVDPVPSLLTAAPDIPEEVAEVVAISLARDPDSRYPSAADMAEALEHAVRSVETPELFIASHRDVGAYLRELLGTEITARREAIRGWSLRCAEGADGPRSQGRRPGAGSPPPPSVRTPRPARVERDSDAGVDSEAPSTKKEASLARSADPSAPSIRAPSSSAQKPPSSSAQPAAAPEELAPEDRPTAPDRVPAAALTAGEQRTAPAPRRVPVKLVALSLLIVLALIAFALIAVRSLL
jgi:serine/threonine protein kinase